MSSAGVDALIWTAAMTAVIVLALLALGAYRRRLKRAETANQPIFTLSEIKRLRDNGEITIPEYEALRAKVLEQSKF